MRHLLSALFPKKNTVKTLFRLFSTTLYPFSVTMDSDSSSYYETTYSEDERIANAVQETRRLRDQEAAATEQARKTVFEDYAKSDLPVFKLPGIKFHTFRHSKIKFSFQPRAITNFVDNSVIFYVSLRYQGGYWKVKRDSLPANYKWKIYKLFYDQDFFIIDDESILPLLAKAHELLMEWTDKQEEFRLEKYERYKKGEDVELDSDDENLFLNEEERVTLHLKKTRILKRMIPPKEKRRPLRRKPLRL